MLFFLNGCQILIFKVEYLENDLADFDNYDLILQDFERPFRLNQLVLALHFSFKLEKTTKIVWQIRVKIALNVVNASKLVEIKIKIFSSKIFCFSSYANMAASDKGILLKKKFWKKFLLITTS